MEVIPPPEDHREIGVVLVGHGGVVDAVHAGGDEDIVQGFFQAKGQAKVGVVEHGAQLEDDLVGYIGEQGDAEDRHLEDPKNSGIEDFPPMEAEGGGDVHVRVDVVDVVKAPEQGILMVDLVPVIKGPVQERGSPG